MYTPIHILLYYNIICMCSYLVYIYHNLEAYDDLDYKYRQRAVIIIIIVSCFFYYNAKTTMT